MTHLTRRLETLAAMAVHKPLTYEQFLRLKGVGEKKLERS